MMSFERESKIFDDIYSGINGYSVSNAGRAEMPPEETKCLIYGEIPFGELLSVIEWPDVKRRVDGAKVFCDLGSGTGKVLIGIALACNNLEKIIGIELVKKLCDTSNAVKNKLHKVDKKVADKIKIINENFLRVDFASPAISPDVVLMHYPMHGDGAERLYLNLEEKLKAELRRGAMVISAIRKLSDLKAFPEIAPAKRIQCPFGGVTMHYHQKA
jgi:SAM-dependent methyltransferase